MPSLLRLLWLIPSGELKVTKNEEVMQELYYSSHFLKKNPTSWCFISHSASKTLTAVVSLLLFLLLMSDQTCTMFSALFTWLLHDSFPSLTWRSLPSNSGSLSLPTATLKLGFASGNITKGFMTLSNLRGISMTLFSLPWPVSQCCSTFM